jgi:Putative prokaryotic signal transducing protein
MAQDPERKDEERDQDQLLTSHALDMVALWDSSNIDSEVEADMIRGVLDSGGIPSLLVGGPEFPNLGFQVMVPRGKVMEAQRLLEEAREAGPEAAAAGELASEE